MVPDGSPRSSNVSSAATARPLAAIRTAPATHGVFALMGGLLETRCGPAPTTQRGALGSPPLHTSNMTSERRLATGPIIFFGPRELFAQTVDNLGRVRSPARYTRFRGCPQGPQPPPTS